MNLMGVLFFLAAGKDGDGNCHHGGGLLHAHSHGHDHGCVRLLLLPSPPLERTRPLLVLLTRLSRDDVAELHAGVVGGTFQVSKNASSLGGCPVATWFGEIAPWVLAWRFTNTLSRRQTKAKAYKNELGPPMLLIGVSSPFIHMPSSAFSLVPADTRKNIDLSVLREE